MEITKNLYLVRHGETLFNQRHKIQGWCDSPLTSNGKKQALQVKEKLSGIEIDHYYCSYASRGSETMELITEHNYTRIMELKERGFGLFEGESEDLNPPLEKFDEFFPLYSGETTEMVQS